MHVPTTFTLMLHVFDYGGHLMNVFIDSWLLFYFHLPVPITRRAVPNALIDMANIMMTLRPYLPRKNAEGMANMT